MAVKLAVDSVGSTFRVNNRLDLKAIDGLELSAHDQDSVTRQERIVQKKLKSEDVNMVILTEFRTGL
jgi:hypothetical protein